MAKSKNFTLQDLPQALPVFPLAGALLLPGGELPLNIFEDRYLAMVRAALATPLRLVGVIQPMGDDAHPDTLYQIGCAGQINSFHETDDGRYLITLMGLCRFRTRDEMPQQSGFRRYQVSFGDFASDLKVPATPELDRTRLLALLKEYFQAEGLSCNWEQIKNTSDDTLMTALAMICPFNPGEKQALLEAINAHERVQTFTTLLELAVMQRRNSGNDDPPQYH